jgi:hypothetical protein
MAILLVIEYALMGVCAAFAYRQGGRAERTGAVWFCANMAVSAVASFAGLVSPVIQLVEDGVFALGLLPLAMIYVSYWMGLLTFIAAALFSLEALYLLNDWQIDTTYIWVNNALWLSAPLVFLICGLSNLRKSRRARRAVAAAIHA